MKTRVFLLSAAALAATGGVNVLPGEGCQGSSTATRRAERALDGLRPAQIHSAAAANAAADSRESLPSSSGRRFEPLDPNRKISFPRDDGAHEDSRVEWWYVTGQLDTASGKRLGYQLTFFRIGI
ncbi:MAG TPA: lipocalin-like domain-containing protein, partial [Thermoanaerobaculia bacterium]|nr:lipocalin-like domain-containing protein [Thermoanaerobaculia bacterium]